MSYKKVFVRAACKLVAISLILSLDARADDKKKPPVEPVEVLATCQMQNGNESYRLILARVESERVNENQLPEGIPFRAPRLESLNLSDKSQLKESVAKQEEKPHWYAPIGSWWGQKQFLIFEQPDWDAVRPQTVPIYSLSYNCELPWARNFNYSYGGSIAVTGHPKRALAVLVGMGTQGHIAAYHVDLSKPVAYGLYQDHDLQVMTNEHLIPSLPISQFKFEAPWHRSIFRVDSLLFKEDELQVVVRFAVSEEAHQAGRTLQKLFRLNLQTKEWTLQEEESPK